MSDCNHKYVFKYSGFDQTLEQHGSTYTRVDYYFCEKCLDEQIKTKSEHCAPSKRPAWFPKSEVL